MTPPSCYSLATSVRHFECNLNPLFTDNVINIIIPIFVKKLNNNSLLSTLVPIVLILQHPVALTSVVFVNLVKVGLG